MLFVVMPARTVIRPAAKAGAGGNARHRFGGLERGWQDHVADASHPVHGRQGLRVSTIKHAHHGFDVDVPGKDSWRHREAGATEVLVSSSQRFALMHELRSAPEPELTELLKRLAPVDLVIIEGFKRALHRKIEVYRQALGKPLLYPDDPAIVGIAADTVLVGPLSCAHIDDVEAIAAMVLTAAAPFPES